MLRQFLLHLDRKAVHLAVIHIWRQTQRFIMMVTLDFFLLALDIALIFGLDFNLRRDLRIAHPCPRTWQG